jgi:hypothetical protein
MDLQMPFPMRGKSQAQQKVHTISLVAFFSYERGLRVNKKIN